MPISLPMLCSSIALMASIVAAIVVIARWKHALRGDAKYVLLSLILLTFLHSLSNTVERLSTSIPTDLIEDYVELLIPALWGCLVYVILQNASRQELREAMARYRSLTDDVLDMSAVGILITDSQGKVVWINQTLERVLGLNRNTVLGKEREVVILNGACHDVDTPNDFERLAQGPRHTKETVSCECHVQVGREAREYWFEYQSLPVQVGLYGGGRIEQFYDITTRKNIEKEREELLGKLETQNAELERYAYTVSHDLKSPLITIRGFLGALKTDIETNDQEAIDEDMLRIDNATMSMLTMLDELLELSRIGRLVNPPESVALVDMVATAVELTHGRIERQGVTIEIVSELPVVYCDRTRIVEVLQNLVDNGVKYMGDQSAPKIEIGAEKQKGEIVCYVRDNGMGIEARYREKVFGLFEQLDSAAEGSGIGLALARRIIQFHGGRMWVESSGLGQGTTFYFSLPAPPEQDESGTLVSSSSV